MEYQQLQHIDSEVAAAIEDEWHRQNDTLEMIASENIASAAVMAAQGSIMTNKYAEGYPSKRYYGGCEYVDVVENLAIERAKQLFKAGYVNVQPHSGSQANMAVYFALLKPGDTLLGMDLSHGGHLTHGSPVSFSGQLYNFVHYGVSRETGRIDYDQLADLARAHRPKMIVAGASAYPRFIDFETLSEVARSIDAYLMVDIAHIAGLVAAGVHPSPIPHCEIVTSTTHKTLRGPRGGLILSRSDFEKQLGSSIFPGIQGGPLMHVIAAKAVAFKEALTEAFTQYQVQTVKNASALAGTLLEEGIDLVSGGTDNHLLLADLTRLNITGKHAEAVLGQGGITVNKNSIPFDERGPVVTSGIRIGTPALTSRGMGADEMRIIARLIADLLRKPNDDTLVAKTRQQVHALCEAFPLQR